MKRAVFYLIAVLIIYCSIGWSLIFKLITIPNETIEFVVYCGLCGGIGGVTYCLRGVYLNACVRDNWSDKWLPWYLIRPIVSFICGVISYLFLETGLIVLQAQKSDTTSNLAFYALAFIAGLNVDKFMEKIEDIAQVTWGIKKSRVATKDDNND